MNTIYTKCYSIEISDKVIIINSKFKRYILKVINIENDNDEYKYICSDIDDNKILKLERSKNSIILYDNDRVIFEEIINNDNKINLNVNIDHSNTVETISKKAGSLAKKVIIVIVSLLAILIFIYMSMLFIVAKNKQNLIYSVWKLTSISVNDSESQKINYLCILNINEDGNNSFKVDMNDDGKFDENDTIIEWNSRVQNYSFKFPNGFDYSYEIKDLGYTNVLYLKYYDDKGNYNLHTYQEIK